MDELESDRRWSRSFETSPDQLAVFAREAIEEDLAGRTEPLDPERPSGPRTLQGVSRTFALTIPQLPGKLRNVVGNA